MRTPRRTRDDGGVKYDVTMSGPIFGLLWGSSPDPA